MQNLRPTLGRGFTSASSASWPSQQLDSPTTTTVSSPLPRTTNLMHVKRATLTSKKNWWLVEMDEKDEQMDISVQPEEPATRHSTAAVHHVHHHHHHQQTEQRMQVSPPPSPPVYRPPRHPTSIFSFPTPTSYSAPSNPTALMAPTFQGSCSEVFKCIVKKPEVVQLEINGEMQSNASDVTAQFLAELRLYTTVGRHRNICAFLGCLENVGMVLEFVEGRTLYDVIIQRPPLGVSKKIDYHNQLLDGLAHLHSYNLSHGDLSLLNVQVTHSADTVKLLDFGRSVSADSTFASPDHGPLDPFDQNLDMNRKLEQIHPGTRPFCAPEVLRGECEDPLLADSYSFGMVLVCLDRCQSVDVKPWDQRKDLLPKDLFDGCTVFTERAQEYLRKYNNGRRRLKRTDFIL